MEAGERRGDFRISPWTGEFCDIAAEGAYRRRVAPSMSRFAMVTVAVSSLFFLGFGYSDVLALGWHGTALLLLVCRAAVSVSGVGVITWLARRPMDATGGIPVSVFEALAFLGFGVVMWFRTDAVDIFGVTMVAMLSAVYFFLPNRVVNATVLSVTATVGFLVLTWLRIPMPGAHVIDLVLLLLLVNTFGLAGGYRLGRVAREQYRLLALAERANASLEGEMSTRRALEEQLQRLATTDDLTALNNRRQYLQRSAEILAGANRTGEPVAVLLMDLDFFKRINDSFGHEAGDEALRRVAGVLRGELRATDLVARYGGEEFAVTLPNSDLGRARTVAERIRGAVECLQIPGTTPNFTATVTIGVAVRGGGEDLDSLLRAADRALYRGKDAGRNRVVV